MGVTHRFLGFDPDPNFLFCRHDADTGTSGFFLLGPILDPMSELLRWDPLVGLSFPSDPQCVNYIHAHKGGNEDVLTSSTFR